MNRAVVAALVFAVLIALVVVLAVMRQAPPVNPRPGGNTAGAPPDKDNQPGKKNGLEIRGPVKRLIECAEFAKCEDKEPRTGTRVFVKKTISIGEQMTIMESPDGWLKTCGYDDDENLKQLKTRPGALPGKLLYEFDLPRDGAYYVFLRAKWYDDCGNSVYVRLDDLPYDMLEDDNGKVSEKSYRWAWHSVLEAGKGTEKAFRLRAGKHRLELATREDGPQFHRILISSDANKPLDDEAKP